MRFSTKGLYGLATIFFGFACLAFGLYEGIHLKLEVLSNPFGLSNDQMILAIGLPSLVLYVLIQWIIRSREKKEGKAY